MLRRDIDVDDVLEVLLQSEIIEDYPDNYPFPSCLMMGKAKDRALHVDLANTTDDLKIISAYWQTRESLRNIERQGGRANVFILQRGYHGKQYDCACRRSSPNA